LKSLSDTRWSCHTESCKALISNYTKIIEVLETIVSPNSKENEDTKRNARPLLKKMLKKETGYMALKVKKSWNDILERSNKTSIQLQKINCDPLKAVNLLISLKHYVSNLRKSCILYENKINQLCPKIKEKYSGEQERIKKKKFSNDSGFNQVSLSGYDKFRVETYNVVIDSFCSQLEKRIEAYNFIKTIFCLSQDYMLFYHKLLMKKKKLIRVLKILFYCIKKMLIILYKMKLYNSKNIGQSVNLHMMTQKSIC